MRAVDLIAKKRDGGVLTKEEIKFLIMGYTKGEIPDYQMAAFQMAVFFKGMTAEETAELTMCMVHSGETIDLTAISGIKVDKHSTGGVADTTTLVLAPLVAAAGVPVAKMSGRGLGHTGGTIDKMEAIPGMKVSLTLEEFIENVKKHNIAVVGQTANLAPADGKIYALRDVTATVDSIPLIASSIMSKKIASGADKILLDVKVGSGAFMKTLDDAKALAQTMVNIGNMVGRETRAIISSMEEPLGTAIGNALEVMEAIEIVTGEGPKELTDVCVQLGAYMLVMGEAAKDVQEGEAKLREIIKSGAGTAKFREFIAAQGGNPAIVDDMSLLPQVKEQIPIYAEEDGFIHEVVANEVGICAMKLGAGREYKGQELDYATGLWMKVRVGDKVKKGDTLAVLYVNENKRVPEVIEQFRAAVKIGQDEVPRTKLIYGIVDKDGFHVL